MDVARMLEVARDQMTVGRVFGDPIEKDGVTLVPVAMVMGGVGGGEGSSEQHDQGEGGGYGILARPLGVYVIGGDTVRFKPVINADRVLTSAAVLAAGVLVARALGRRGG
ncbi:MAG: spore germination protein GerW family protein [Jiangellales bacterium]